MKNNERVLYGLIITIVIFVVSTLTGSEIDLNMDFVPGSFLIHSLMLLLSIFVINSFKKYVDYKFSLPKFKKLLKPILFGILATIIVNFLITILTKAFGGTVDSHPLLTKMTPLQTFTFVFVYASIAEELLFRGFLLNILKPLQVKGINILKRKISLPVIISAVAFGLGHLILITTGAGALFLLRVVIFTTILGVIAGYYQEKYNNNVFAIIVHMAGNLMGLMGSIIMNVNM